MAIYEYNGRTFEASDDVPKEQVYSYLQGQTNAQPGQANVQQTQSPAESHTYTNPQTPISNPEMLVQNKDWLHASKTLWDMNNSTPFAGSEQDLSEYGLDQMGWFNYNLPRMAVDTARISAAKPEQKQAFLYLMNRYDDLGMSWGGTMRFLKGAALDPTTYAGLSTLGIATGASQATKVLSKEALKSMLKAGVMAGVEGAIQNVAANSMEQQVRVTAGERKEFSLGESAKSAALGFGAGAVLGGAVDVAATALRKGEGKAAQALAGEETRVGAKEAETPPVEPTGKAAATPSAEGANYPPVPEGHTRLFRGEGPHDPNLVFNPGEAPGRHFTGSLVEAEKYAEMSGGTVQYVDVPTEKVKFNENSGHRLYTVLDEATANQKKPYAPVDPKVEPEVKPEVPKAEPKPSLGNPIIDAVQEFAADSGLRVFPRTKGAVSEAAAKAIETIKRMTPDALSQAIEDATRHAVTGEQELLLKNAIAETNQRLHKEILELRTEVHAATDQAVKDRLYGEIDDLMNLQKSTGLRDADLRESSASGRILGDRSNRGYIDTGSFRDLSPEKILEAKGIRNPTPIQKQRARDEYLDALAKQDELISKHDEVKAYDAQIEKAKAQGNTEKATTLAKERELVKAKIAALDPESKSAYDKLNAVTSYANEYVISTVFTTKTAVINVVPSALKLVYRPALDFFVKGADAKAFREMTATYRAYHANIDSAFRYARFAFKVERGMLNGLASVDKMLEHDVMFKGAFGRYLRFFPRVLNATDEFFGQLNYRAFVQSMAEGDAYELGRQAGLTGERLESFITSKAAEAQAKAFDPIKTSHVIDHLRKVGFDHYGLRGEKLDAFIKRELDNNADLYQKATEQSGLDYANDSAFKREFSDSNTASRWAKFYESQVNSNPMLRLLGQLFFRTPVRVFQEGFRLTAGVQFIDPTFLRDLRGLGPGGVGGHAQVRAQGEAILSYGIAAAIMSAYAQGNITGGGPDDWKAKRDWQGSKTWKPYVIRFGDHEFEYRNYDPFSTPLKIITNALDRLKLLEMRQAQGEFVEDKQAELMAVAAVGSMSIVQAVKDANLTDGIDQLVNLVTNLANPEERQEQIMRWLGQKVQLAIPNQVNKTRQALGNDTMTEPASMEQYIRNRWNSSDPLIPRRYDALGFEDKSPLNSVAVLTGFNLFGKDDYNEKLDPKRLAVRDALAQITALTGKTFQAPYNAASWAPSGVKGQAYDLRTTMTADGKESYYDRLNRYVRELGAVDGLYETVVKMKGELTSGTMSVHDKGTMVAVASEQLGKYRKAAFATLMSEEADIIAKHESQINDRANVFGRRDTMSPLN